MSGRFGTGGRAIALGLLACALIPAAALAQRPSQTPNPPPYFAIQNATVVPVTGPVIENGTVVIANGLIEAVGSNVTIPPEAWVIDGSGLTVYPGLFDAMSSVGVRSEDGGGGGPGGGGGGNPFAAGPQEAADGPEDRPGTTSWTNAADLLDPEDDRIENWREGGFTTALIVPDEGIVTGQGAIINLAGDDQEMVVKTPAALRITLSPPGGFRAYPSSLFGVISYVKQLYSDADHQAQYAAAYEADPAGQPRPMYDRALYPIQRSIAEGWPTIFPGMEKREIRRAVKLGADIGAPTIVAGAHEAYQVADELAAANVSVLVNLDWPERTRDADPNREESLQSLTRRAYAPSTPARLHEAGARFAFYSAGLSSPRQVKEKVRKAIEAGLPEDAALRALTLGPAQVYGVDDRMGSIEAGKIANLVVTDGALFDEDTKVKMVFVDGQKFEELEAARPTEPPVADMSGRWLLTVPTPQQTQEITADIEMAEDGTLTGTLVTDRGEQEITEGWVSGDQFSFVAMMSMGGRTMEITYTGTLEGDRLNGTVSFGGRFSTDFEGERPGGNS